MQSIKTIALTAITLASACPLLAQTKCLCHAGQPDDYAPIGVMASHTHEEGGWMLSYRYMNMHMSDLYVDDSKINSSAAGYTVVPTSMDMEMHMLGLMYSPSDSLTLMFMTNYLNNTMDMEFTKGMNKGKKTNMQSQGWGDISIGALQNFYTTERSKAHFGLSLSLPTGSTSESFITPMGMNHHQPFPMQLGTGTFDLLPSITYLNHPNPHWSWGAQANGRIHLNTNNQGYSFGDSIGATTWISRNINPFAAISCRLAAKSWKGIQGDSDNGINPMHPGMSSPADPNNHGGTRLDAAIGINLLQPATGIRIAAEFAVPLYQNLNGPQLGQDWTLTLGSQFTW